MIKKVFTFIKEYILEHNMFLSLFIVLGILAYYFSSIDIYITNLFYNKENGFFLGNNTFGLIVYHGAYYVTVISIILLLILLGLSLKGKKPFGLNKKAILFLIVVLAMAPGIVVNSILKEHVGRPRPIHIEEFGGNKIFQPPFKVSNQCESNCSFVSGHASFAFTFMVLGLFFRNNKRKIVLSSTFLFGAIVGFVRVFQGKHFFTDIVFAFFFTWLTITIIYKLFYPNDDLPESIIK